MNRFLSIFLALAAAAMGVHSAAGASRHIVVADSSSRAPLPSASVFDRSGKGIGVSNARGVLPPLSADNFPVTVRYLGFYEKVVPSADVDTVFLAENVTDLPEFVLETRRQRLIHVLAYVREFSTLSSYTDTIFLFREKMVDFMIPTTRTSNYKGWLTPRLLKGRSYYRFTDSSGLDSVSHECNHHFSWSDWIGIVPSPELPQGVRSVAEGSDTLRGKYSPAEIWNRRNQRVSVNVNVLADKRSRKWVPHLANFFRRDVDFEQCRLTYNYDNVTSDSISPADITGYSFLIDSNGRGRGMFQFNHRDEPFVVNTYAEVYVLDKEYITVKEAKQWGNRKFNSDELEIFIPAEAPPLRPEIRELMARVADVDPEGIRLDLTPDERYVGLYLDNRNFSFGNRVLGILKQLTGITLVKSHRNVRRRWHDFRHERQSSNRNKE